MRTFLGRALELEGTGCGNDEDATEDDTTDDDTTDDDTTDDDTTDDDTTDDDPSSESLPTPGKLDDVTEVSELRRGLVEGRKVFHRMDFTGCSLSLSRSRCLSGSHWGHSAGRPEDRDSEPGVTVPPTLGRRYCRSLSIEAGLWCVEMS